MSDNNNTLPSTFASYDEAEESLSWVESQLKCADTDWSMYGSIFKEYIDMLAKSFSEGNLTDDECEELYTALPRKNYPYNLSHYEGWFEDAVQKYGRPKVGSGSIGWEEGMPLDSWIPENLERLRITQYEDSNMTAKYAWLFDTGEERQVVEYTGLTHNSASEFEKAIDKTFVFVEIGDPIEKYRKGTAWKKQFMRKFINKDSRVHVERKPGPRTKCIEALKDKLEVRTAYFEIDDASDADGVYIDPTEPDVMWVRSTLIQHEATEHGFENTEAIRTELSFRGVVDGKVSYNKRLSDGQNPRWWKLPRDFADVATEDEDKTPSGEERFAVDDESGEDHE